ncbi:MAG: ABC transporter permease [Armatimonadetes bacterium]|nr:ABC transporter permease [Akkermansiaceae bacterium]
MKLWILIPFYLWKNTCRRWLEYPVSPASKILIPTLLGFLAVIVLALFAEVERELRVQLEKNSVYTVYVSEFVPADGAATILRRSYEEEILWAGRYRKDVIRQVRQPLVSANWRRTQSIPLLAFTASANDFQQATDPESPPTVWLLSDDVRLQGTREEILLSGKRALAEVRPVPPWIRKELSIENAVAAPAEMIEPFLLRGFINHTIAIFQSIEEVEGFVTEMSSYYRAEKRQIKIVSGLGILKNLKRISDIQAIVRSLIVAGCGTILALTLGSVAWLEYRQDSYLIALLKSFGTPSIVLLFHMFLENLILVFIGIFIVNFTWIPLYGIAGPKLREIGFATVAAPAIPAGDLMIIVLASIVGVVLAMVPIALGIRKPAGLILQ